MFVIVVVLARVLRKNRSDVKLHIPYLLGKIKLKEICPQDKKKVSKHNGFMSKRERHERDTWIQAGSPPKGNKKI